MVGSAAATQTVQVSNSGTSAASVSNVAATGDFSQTNNCTSIAVGGSCTVTVTFEPTAGGSRTGTLTVTSNANNSPTTVGLSGSGIDGTTNLAAGQPTSASSVNSPYVAANLTDPDPSTYWESANGSFPQWAQVDLGQSYSIDKVTLKLPPSTAWGARTQTLSLLGIHRRLELLDHRGLGRVHVRPERQQQHGHHHVRRHHGPVRAGRTSPPTPGGPPGSCPTSRSSRPCGGSSSATLSVSPASLTFASQAPQHHQRRAARSR